VIVNQENCELIRHALPFSPWARPAARWFRRPRALLLAECLPQAPRARAFRRADTLMPSVRRKSAAMILHFQSYGFVLKLQANPGLLRSRMALHIIQRLLQYAIHLHAGIAVQWKRCTQFFVMQFQTVCRSTVGIYQSSVLSRPCSSRSTGCSAWDNVRMLFNVDCAISRTSCKSSRSGAPAAPAFPLGSEASQWP